MTVGVFVISLLLAATFAAVASETGSRKVTLVVWGGHFTPDYWQLRDSRSKRILFRKEVALLEQELELSAMDLLKKQLESEALKENLSLYWRGVVYRPGVNGGPAELIFNEGPINRFKLSALQSNDVIVFLLWRGPLLMAGKTLHPKAWSKTHSTGEDRQPALPTRFHGLLQGLPRQVQHTQTCRL